MKNRSHRCNITRPRPRHGHKYTKYKLCLSIMMAICVKQQLSNIWSSIHEKVKKHWGWAEKIKRLVKKGLVYSVIQYTVFKFTCHWYYAHAQLKL